MSAETVLSPLEGFLTLAQLRTADELIRSVGERLHGELFVPLGLNGRHLVGTSLMDANSDFFLPDSEVELTPATTGWEIMRAFAEQWAAYPLLDQVDLALLFLPGDMVEVGWLGVSLYYVGGTLTTEEEAQLPA
jgi:hypothetical protein